MKDEIAQQRFPSSKFCSDRLFDPQRANNIISKRLTRGKPTLIARFGSVEGRICANSLFDQALFSDETRVFASRNAGISHPNDSTLRAFSHEYLAAASKADLLGIFDFPEQEGLVEYLGTPRLAMLRALDPAWLNANGVTPWSHALEGKRVLVIHPFAKSIEVQYRRRQDVPFLRETLPSFELQTLIPPNTAGSGPSKGRGLYLKELARLKAEVSQRNFDVAIIGAGGYGLPIAGFIKDLGKQAIHAGGATQLYFAIRGRRWDSFIDRRINNVGWVRPSEDEVPEYAPQIEKGCYW